MINEFDFLVDIAKDLQDLQKETGDAVGLQEKALLTWILHKTQIRISELRYHVVDQQGGNSHG